MNSDKSVEKFAKTGEYPSEKDRAQALGQPLAECFPDINISILFFDEETPLELYSGLKKQGVLHNSTLHKWGYGTKPDEPAIIGAELFGEGCVYASPLPFDEKPVCYDKTVKKENNNIAVIDLRSSVMAYDDLIAKAKPTLSADAAADPTPAADTAPTAAANNPAGTLFGFFTKYRTPIAIAAAASAVAVTTMMSGNQ